MEENHKYEDLCITCIYRDECVRRKHHGKPVYFCEKFEYSLELSPKSIQKQVSLKRVGMSIDEVDLNDAQGNPLGLCANCSTRKTCKHIRPLGGVWHCEDYS